MALKFPAIGKEMEVLAVLGFVMCVLVGTAVYEKVGAPAVLQSPKSPGRILRNQDGRCESAVRRGGWKYSEDRTLCSLDIQVPFPGPNGVIDTWGVDIVAVFDGHNGAEASEMASKLLLEYFTEHANILLDETYSFLSGKDGLELDIGRTKFTWSSIFGGAFRLEILKESLLRAIDAIDAKIGEDASRSGSGSTATVILMADGQRLVANTGDSSAFLCSEMSMTPVRKRRNGGLLLLRIGTGRADLKYFFAKELTENRHPKFAGGQVSESAGVISVIDWQPLTANDTYLVATTDSVVERLHPQVVCVLLWEQRNCSCPVSSLADSIVDAAIHRGSTHDLAAVVLPLRLPTLPAVQPFLPTYWYHMWCKLLAFLKPL